MTVKYSEIDLDIMTRTVWGEARGEGRDGQIAVAWIIRNRAANPRWWGRSVAGVCHARFQFSCWNIGDPNRQKMLDLKMDDPAYVRIRAICKDVLDGKIPDPTRTSDHYLRTDWIERTKWAKENPQRRTYVHGSHSFYRLELRAA